MTQKFAIEITTKTGDTGLVRYIDTENPLAFPTKEWAEEMAETYAMTDVHGNRYEVVPLAEKQTEQ